MSAPTPGQPQTTKALVGWRVNGTWRLTRRGRDRLARKLTAPELAHGRRTLDGSYFTVWACEHEHRTVGTLDGPGPQGCLACAFDATQPGRYRPLSRAEAYEYISQIEGGPPASALFDVFG